MNHLVLKLSISLSLVTAAWGSPVNITFTTLPATYENTTYNGFVGGVFNAGSGAAQLFDNLVCNDFLAVTYVPSGPDPYTVESLSALSLAGTKFGRGDLTPYEEAALLINGDGGSLLGLSHLTNSDGITSYQYAIWRLFTSDSAMAQELGSGAPVNFGTSSALMAQALSDVTAGSQRFQSVYGSLRIYTPDPIPGGPQEFLQIDSTGSNPGYSAPQSLTQTPEPVSMVLIGLGLIGVGCCGKVLKMIKGMPRL